MTDTILKPEMLQEKFREAENDSSIKIKSVSYPESQKYLLGAHFAASVNIMDVNFTRNENTIEETVPIFVKTNPKSKASVRDLQRFEFFKKEGEWYRTISRNMLDFCEKTAPTIGEKLKHHIPVCYYTDADSIVVMEDLNKQDYETHDYDLETLQDLHHVKLVMKFYAVFHGVGYVMKKQNLLENVTPFLHEIFFNKNNEILPKFMDSFCKPALNLFKGENEQKYHNILEKISKYSVKTIDQKFKLCEPFTVISHGDSCNNNMMFKYGDDGNPVNVKFVDWQCINFSSMTVDLNYFFYSSTTSEFREEYLQEMLRYYYRNFILVVQELQGGKATFNDFTFEDLYEDFQDHNIVGFIAFISMLLICFSPAAEECDHAVEHTEDENESLFDGFIRMAANISKHEGSKDSIKGLISTVLDEMGDNLLSVLK